MREGFVAKRPVGFFGLSDHLMPLSAHGDPLEELGRIIDFEAFRPMLVAALAHKNGIRVGDRLMIRWPCSRC